MNVTDNISVMGKHLNAGTFVQHDTSKQSADVEDLEQEVGMPRFEWSKLVQTP